MSAICLLFVYIFLFTGVMTNPNCEYGANFIAIHTLAQWNKCNVDGTLPTVGSDAVSCNYKPFIFTGKKVSHIF